MRIEKERDENNQAAQVVTTEMSEEEKREEQRLIYQKIYVQEEVMKRLGFLRDSFSFKNFDPTNLEFSAVEEEKIRQWSSNERKAGVNNASIFDDEYNKTITEKHFLGKVLSEDDLNVLVNKIVERFLSNKDALILN